MKRLAALITLLLSLTLLAACASPGGASGDAAQARPLRIGLLSIDDSLPFFMAEELGLFEKHGVQAELIPFGSAADKESALEAGQLDGDMTDLVVAALLRKGGTDVKIVCVALGAEPSEGRFDILGAPGGAESLSQLEGQAVAVGDNTIVHYLCRTVLARAGVEDIVTQNIPSLSLRYEALMNGAVPAAVLPDPLASLAVLSGAVPLFDDTAGEENLSQSVVLFTQEALSSRPEDVKAALAAYFEAMEYINANPDAPDVRAAIAAFTSVPEEIFDVYATPSYTPRALPGRDIVEDTLSWMAGQGLLDAPCSYDELVDGGWVS